MVRKARSSHFNTVGTYGIKMFQCLLCPLQILINHIIYECPLWQTQYSTTPHLTDDPSKFFLSATELGENGQEMNEIQTLVSTRQSKMGFIVAPEVILGTILILRQHIFGLFLTHLPYVSIDSNERQQLPFSEPTNPIPSRT